jgi:predicted nucleic acid-binding protein
MRLLKHPLFDTNFFIALRRGEPEAYRLLTRLSREQLVTSAIVQVEYATGEFTVDPRLQKSVEAMFLRFLVLPFEGMAAKKAMREAAKMNLPKLPNPHKKLFDLMIAATSWAHNRTLLTENTSDFAAFNWVKVANWRNYGR